MKLGYTIIYVPDVAESLAFYEKAVGLPRRFLHESGSYGELDTGETTVDEAHAKALTAGAIEIKAPESKPWGQIVSYFRCPDGTLVEICSPIGG